MTIREATVADVDRLTLMGEHFLAQSEYRSMLNCNPDQLRAFCERCVTGQAGDAAILVIVTPAGTLAGMIGVLVAAHPFSGERIGGDLFWWVEPEFRGCGLPLMHAAEAWAKARGAVRFQMVAPNDRVARLYRHHGYAPLEATFQRSL